MFHIFEVAMFVHAYFDQELRGCTQNACMLADLP
uniref:Uncharacterized protein n=1 Tax=Anguilla anguilla TaxID=7936 RepID=A0A0E9SU07_ANGAN